MSEHRTPYDNDLHKRNSYQTRRKGKAYAELFA